MEHPFGHQHIDRHREEEESHPPPPQYHHEHHEQDMHHVSYEQQSHEHGNVHHVGHERGAQHGPGRHQEEPRHDEHGNIHHEGYERGAQQGHVHRQEEPRHEEHGNIHHEGYERGAQRGHGQHQEEPRHEEHGVKGFFSGLVSHVGHSNPVTEKLGSRKTVRVYPKAKEDYSLTIRAGKVVVAPMDENDPCQHWIKDETYSTKIKDGVGYPAFSLVNKATGEAIKHSLGQSHPVRLVPFNPDYLDESVLWTESDDVGSGFRCIRMVNNIHLNFDAFNGDKDHGGVKDGTIIVLWEWAKGDNQRWKIVPY